MQMHRRTTWDLGDCRPFSLDHSPVLQFMGEAEPKDPAYSLPVICQHSSDVWDWQAQNKFSDMPNVEPMK